MLTVWLCNSFGEMPFLMPPMIVPEKYATNLFVSIFFSNSYSNLAGIFQKFSAIIAKHTNQVHSNSFRICLLSLPYPAKICKFLEFVFTAFDGISSNDILLVYLPSSFGLHM